MNKTISINLGGFFFHIDEDAYQKLSRYFDAVKRSLSPDGRDEIVKDIESRIAELFQERLQNEKQVVGITKFCTHPTSLKDEKTIVGGTKTIHLDKIPKRIISLVPSQTELLVDLGLEDRIVGITKFCVHPKHLKQTKTIVGGTKTIHIKKIKALKPDIVLCNKEENTQEMIAE